MFNEINAGTDDDLPPSHQNRMPRGGGRVAGNGRPPVMGPVPYPRMFGDTDMEAQIHKLEQEAYSSVLRAFKAQADAISWVLICLTFCFFVLVYLSNHVYLTANDMYFLQEKESLITELRKELRLSNEEHRELLGRVNADDMIRRIRSGGVKQVSFPQEPLFF